MFMCLVACVLFAWLCSMVCFIFGFLFFWFVFVWFFLFLYVVCFLCAWGSSFGFCESCISIFVILLGCFWMICLGSRFVMVIRGLSVLHVKLVSFRSFRNSSM